MNVKMLSYVLIHVTVTLLVGIRCGTCDELYIIPSMVHPCPVNTCITLEQFADDPIGINASNITLNFIGESHNLSKSVYVTNLTAFSMISVNVADSTEINIFCSKFASFVFEDVETVSFRGLTFTGCNGNKVESVAMLTIEHCRFLGEKKGNTSLSVINSTANITDTFYISNTFGDYREHVEFLSIHHGSTIGGALIITQSTVTFDRCLFESNEASVGGAIFSELGSNVTISNSDFTANHASECDPGLCYGGALFVGKSVTMTVHNSRFQNNTSSGRGGVAVVINATLNLFSSVASSNDAYEFGGAISANDEAYIAVDNCNFTQNSADNGGALDIERVTYFAVTRSRFMYNVAHEYFGGGAILAISSDAVAIEECAFDGNEASYFGGAIFLRHLDRAVISLCNFTSNTAFGGGALTVSNGTSTIHESFFQHNTADHSGGCIDADDESAVTLNNSTFSNNRAIRDGGVAAVGIAGVLNINNGTFDNNFAKYGGVVRLWWSALFVDNSTFNNNGADVDGAIVASYVDCSISVSNSTFDSNYAYHDGGVAYFYNGTESSFDNCLFTNNRADFGGVLAQLRGSYSRIENCTFSDNIAENDGATLYGYPKCTFDIKNSLFDNNIARKDGVINVADNSNVRINNSTFFSNVVGRDGGVIFVYDNTSLTIDNTHFMSNSAVGSGGAIYGSEFTYILIRNTTINKCSAQNSGGAIQAQRLTHVQIESSIFKYNVADYGGFMRVYQGATSDIRNCTFEKHTANLDGGVMAIYKNSTVEIEASSFVRNIASFGGVFAEYESLLLLKNCTLSENRGEVAGVIRVLTGSRVVALESSFSYNSADRGGVLYGEEGDFIVERSNFVMNTARLGGAVVHFDRLGNINVSGTTFTRNIAELNGGVMIIYDGTVATFDNCTFYSNEGKQSGGSFFVHEASIYIQGCTFDSCSSERDGAAIAASNYSTVDVRNTRFSNNTSDDDGGAISMTQNSTLTISSSNFTKNSANDDGGAIYVTMQSNVTIDCTIFLQNSASSVGGAVYVTRETTMNINNCTFSHNDARTSGGALAVFSSSSAHFKSAESDIIRNTATSSSGGGIYLSGSSLTFNVLTNISENEARSNGGGIFAVNSHIRIGSTVHIIGNIATRGGGVSLANADIYDAVSRESHTAMFALNSADYGGAFYVDDSSIDGTCSSGQCFFGKANVEFTIEFEDNHAAVSGDNLYGGLLDRCEVDVKAINYSLTALKLSSPATARFMEISNIDKTELGRISSLPVNLCFCENGEPDCDRTTLPVQVRRGDRFSVTVAAVDQVRHPVSATVQSSLQELTLPESQSNQTIGSNCSTLNYRVAFPQASNRKYNLTLFAEGPCNGAGISKLTVDIEILECSCGAGFMPENNTIRCVCTCDERDTTFTNYISECNDSSNSVIRQGVFWITYLHDSNDNYSRYLISPYCPYDYCKSPTTPVEINLDLHNGSDAQCDNNRGGVLCGSCLPGYSVSLGSSKCLECPHDWYGLFIGITIAAIIAGIVFVFSLLFLNVTVAVGTFNSIIFYANIINANKSVYFSQPNLTFIPVFISWLNLDIGFDICLFDGMDMYAKIWIQLAFPAYMIFLVVMIIWVASCSEKFSNLLGKRHPVATLATVILLSYTKLLQTIITSFSYVALAYPNGTKKILWLPDASIEFSEHRFMLTALIGVGLVILIFGLAYTIIMFSWQWLLTYSDSRYLKWTKSAKLNHFVNCYHAPFNAKHRYWFGLLLLVRVFIYLVAAFSSSHEQPITLLATIIVMCSLLLYKTIRRIKIYRNLLINIVESSMYFNIAIFAVITLYTYNLSRYRSAEDLLKLQTAAAYTSVGIVLIVLLAVLVVHTYRYGSKRLYKFIGQCPSLVQRMYTSPPTGHQTQFEDSHDEFLDALDTPRTRFNSAFHRLPKVSTTVIAPFRKRSTHDVIPITEEKIEKGDESSV